MVIQEVLGVFGSANRMEHARRSSQAEKVSEVVRGTFIRNLQRALRDHRYYAVRVRQPFLLTKGLASRTSIFGAIAGDRLRSSQQKGARQPYPLTD
jgi:hypothetical protein